MKPLVQYQIHKDLSQSTIYRIWRDFLKHDHRWHFFHEGNYCLIRTAKKSKGLEKRLTRMKIKFSVRVWEDPHQTVRKYQGLFEKIFHAESILGLNRRDDEVYSILNRVSHCMINMSGVGGYEGIALMAKLSAMEMMLYANHHVEIAKMEIGDFLGPVMKRIEELEKYKPKEEPCQ